MLDLRAEAIATWLAENGSEDIARLLRRKCVDEPPELTSLITHCTMGWLSSCHRSWRTPMEVGAFVSCIG
jgi:hypothetical protein